MTQTAEAAVQEGQAAPAVPNVGPTVEGEGEDYKIELTSEEEESISLANAPQQTTEDLSSEQISNESQQMSQSDHAVHYVLKVRNRFSQELETYWQFIKILNMFQKQQKGIEEVLEEVSSLFAGHSDLLMEFTCFLPEAVQEQAKERLERAARESEHGKVQQNAEAAAAAESLGMGVNDMLLGPQEST